MGSDESGVRLKGSGSRIRFKADQTHISISSQWRLHPGSSESISASSFLFSVYKQVSQEHRRMSVLRKDAQHELLLVKDAEEQRRQ